MKTWLAGVASVALLSGSAVLAGGWAVITVTHLPRAVEAGRPQELAFAVRVHGVHLTDGLAARVEAISGEERVEAPVRPAAMRGHYAASLTLPRAGVWTVVIHSGHGTNPANATWLTVRALAPGEAPPTPSPSEWGERLFVAKGCMTCHVHDGIETPSAQLAIGPRLGRTAYDPERLVRILTAPPGHTTPERGRMPKLELDQEEIAALVALLNQPASRATRY